jgi:predicted Zn-dependent protease
MLFDLRGRGRRRTVQAVYLGLALLLLGGLVLFGVGSGNGGGGILNAFTNGGGGTSQQVSSQETAALRATKLRPTDPTAWAALVSARWSNAGQGNNYNASTGTFTASGRKELTLLSQDWQRYLKLTKKPDPTVMILAARSYGQLGQYANAADAWELQTVTSPTAPKGYECLAATAYAAKQTRKGDLAAAKALTLVPKSTAATLKLTLNQAKTNPQVAQSC